MNPTSKIAITDGNELLHHFMDGKWKIARKSPGGHWQSSNAEFLTTPVAQLVCDRWNKWEKPDMQYAVVANVLDYTLRYHMSWNELMGVVEKIEGFSLFVEIDTDSTYIRSRGCEDERYPWLVGFPDADFYVDNDRSETNKIQRTWMACILFIKWYFSKT